MLRGLIRMLELSKLRVTGGINLLKLWCKCDSVGEARVDATFGLSASAVFTLSPRLSSTDVSVPFLSSSF